MKKGTFTKVIEDAPANAVGGGQIAGIGVGASGEPGMTPKNQKKYRDKNKAAAPVVGTMQRRKTLQQFINGK